MFNRFLRVSLLPALLLFVLPAGNGYCGADYSGRLLGHSLWQGEVRLTGPVEVPLETTLTIAAGCRVTAANPAAKLTVRGTLLVQGSESEPVVFQTPPGWQGIEFMESGGKSIIRQARFSDSEAALSSYGSHFEVTDSEFSNCRFGVRLLRESDPLIAGNRFIGGKIAIDNEMRSSPTIRDNLFRGFKQMAILASHNSRGMISNNRFIGNQQGVGLQQPYPDKVVDNLFRDNEIAMFCNQTKDTPQILNNRFENNRTALINYAFAYPRVRGNVFVGNGIAIRNDQYGSPFVENNRFEKNETAIYNYRKSNPRIRNNVIADNDLALFCDYSSYPLVRENNFLGNRQAVKLGIYQSADWEKRSGSKALVMQKSRERGSKNSMLAQAPTDFEDRIDVSKNWWGADNQRLAAADEQTNDDLFWDRHDQPTVVYEGFGPEAYQLDRVVFQPVLDAPVAAAGPQR
ncbi:hypothetical protein C2E25_06615 [Geothermobacter hydrogeniphilus]|uniref:Periplasmic copper-binding protein NosD beta helix domain-containing protein n=1 Tax=Geothermobacter hydrogeniphilus TaxID=1969733 RepID=A0A2K2HB59_9BACT|nr:right-handed parallel beta-helix repeat-containing protein [Geothermobacter hydrogeniphilus]PNU20544.1 hypothetical protein C2E25_06615 [Geothermobacter hydrogeniphilus]